MSIKKTSNNLILHKRDLVLLKRSEEAKNIEIYGNMYECLKTYNTLSEYYGAAEPPVRSS